VQSTPEPSPETPNPPIPLPDAQPSGWARLWQAFREVVETVLLAAILFIAINLVSARIRVDGASMEPNLHTGEYILVNRLAYRWNAPQRGDVLVFRLAQQGRREYIKRIIGLPGDRVEIRARRVYVNGDVLAEDYIAEEPTYSGEWQVPEDAIFALGDNRNNSTDCHNWGPIPLKDVVGQAILIYWPPAEWQIISSVSYPSEP